jgi:phosphate/phosphite/phosphonate ABC transporter binding protein
MRKCLLFILLIITGLTKAQTFRLAVYQYADNPRIKNLQPLAEHLQKALGITTVVKSYPTVHDLIGGMTKGEVDVAFISTFGYLLFNAGKQNHPMKPVAALIASNAKDNYKTAFVCRRSANLSRFGDIRKAGSNLRMAFVATGSTSGNLVPRLLLTGIGINEADQHFASVRYAGTHVKAIEWLLTDSADIAAMGSNEWDKLDSAKRSSLQLLKLSSEIPLGPVLVNRHLAKDTEQKIVQQLLQLHQSNAEALNALKAAWSEAKQATNFIPITPDYYRPYLKQFGKENTVNKIIRQFIQ